LLLDSSGCPKEPLDSHTLALSFVLYAELNLALGRRAVIPHAVHEGFDGRTVRIISNHVFAISIDPAIYLPNLIVGISGSVNHVVDGPSHNLIRVQQRGKTVLRMTETRTTGAVKHPSLFNHSLKFIRQIGKVRVNSTAAGQFISTI